jgi:flagellar hook-associated protein 3 FlgL
MSMRVTQKAVAMDSLNGLYSNLSKVNDLQQQLTSGKTINRPSDSPTGTNSVLMLTSQQAAIRQQQRNVSDGQQWMNTTDSTLQSMVTAVQRIRTLVVQASSTGSQSADARAANASEVSQVAQSLLQSANTQLGGRPIFGGNTGNSAAYDGKGTFIGTPVDPNNPATQISRRISNTASVRIDLTGPEAFGDSSTPGGSLFDVVNKIATDMVNNPGNLSTDQANLDAALTRMSNGLASIGARSNRLNGAASDLSTTALNVTANLSDVQDVDMAKTIMQLQQQQTTYQAALMATSKIISPTLADYLR